MLASTPLLAPLPLRACTSSRCLPAPAAPTVHPVARRCFAAFSAPSPSAPPPARLSLRCRSSTAEAAAPTATAVASLQESPLVPIMHQGELQLHLMADMAGVYAIYDKHESIQYIGLSRKIDVSVSNHMRELPDLTAAVKFVAVSDSSKDALVAVWKMWIEQSVEETGNIPPGNAPGETRWQSRKAAPLKKEIRLTAGKGITGITIEQLVDQVVKDNKVVAFIKGSRSQPQCGFSFKMLQLLNEAKADYEVVNVLDDVHNPGLRDAIKAYSQWPTIPQLYIKGEFIGGADICEQMAGSGELQQALKA